MNVMNFFVIVLCFFGSSVFLYFLGKFLFLLGHKKIGHYLVGSAIAGDFGLCKKTRSWLSSNCPHYKKCDLWTCGSYKDCPHRSSNKNK